MENNIKKGASRKRFYKNKQKHMMEVVNKKKRWETSSDENELSGILLHEMRNAPPTVTTENDLMLIPQNNSELRNVPPSVTPESDLSLTQNNPELRNVPPSVTPESDLSLTQNNPEWEQLIDESSVNHSLESDDLPNLEVVEDHPQEKEIIIGRRIINVSHFYSKLQQISEHGPFGCNLNYIDLVGEKQSGLMSKLTFICRMCKLKFIINTDSDDENYLPINNCAVAGIVSIGGGHSQLEELSSALNLPLISNKMYQSIHNTLSKKWVEVARETMDHAAEKEKNWALADGKVNKDGIPIIDVVVDGCYSKRSYKTNYSAFSGAGAIIGKRSGELLYVGVRNKYCYICDRAEKKKNTIKEHKCFKNYTGPSTGMESEIIVEGFKQSVEVHNLIYGRLISDGDSSTYNKILQSQPYQKEGITVEKIECRNHLLRNFCNKLQNLQTDTRYIIRHRKLLTKNTTMSIRSVIKKAIEKNKNDESPNVQNLFEDILLSHHHAFGNHSQCKSYFCNNLGQQENVTSDFFSSSLWQRICLLTQNIAAHARSLIHDVDSNIVERFHSVIAKYVGGKRVNFSLKQSYGTRCNAAAVSFNTHKSISRVYKTILTKSPQGKLKMLEERRIKKRDLNSKYMKRKSRNITFKKPDKNYGEQCNKPDMPDEVLENIKDNFVTSLKKTAEERAMIEKQTILQRDSSEWMELRRSLLTASNFGRVIKRKCTTRCANLVKDILYKSNIDHVSAIKHGQLNEKTAIMQLAKQEGIKIEPCGLFLDEELPFLGATPDGLCGENIIIEVKCPITAYKLGLEKAIDTKKINFWVKNKEGSKINEHHNWYYQVQGQLHITKRQKCLFAVWSDEKEKLKTELIIRDDMFWHNKMKTKLEKFYMECLLPEIVDPRHTRSLPIREPGITISDQDTPQNQNTEKAVEPSIDIDVTPKHAKASQNKNMPSILPKCSRYLSFDEL